ncbi:MAG TPA: SpoIIE family protein phosphatase [Spirochaetota bacterium]|nr:SpoIIE family protein phosphatase [Spirochaetota bacterium]HSA13168.1 SpoIIE family protein phosphatase [Spirochaetota bacterium]
MRFFYFIARNISYTFAISLYTVFFGWVVGVFGVLMGTAFNYFPYDRFFFFMKFVAIPPIIVASLGHYIVFGLLTPLGIPALMSLHRYINKGFKKREETDIEEIKKLYGAFSDLPLHNLAHSLFWIFFIAVIIILVSLYAVKVSNLGTIDELKTIFRTVTLSIIFIMILYGMSSYLLTESLTNNERTYYYNQLLKNGLSVKPRALIGVRVKFGFLIILMIIVLLTFAALLERGTFEEYGPWVIVAYFFIAIMACLVLMLITTRSIVNVLSDMSRVTREIAAGGRAGFRFISLEKEIVTIEQALMDMAREMDGHRKNLESKVEQRTMELQSALADLKVRDDQIQKQLDMASVIQRSILPGNIEDWNELKFAVRYIAMEKIGGDFYDVHQLKGDKLGVMIADVSGHGIPAALVTTMAKISFGNAGLKNDSPKRIFQEVNQSILDHVRTQDYMTCFMVVIDDEYNVVYSNASHQKAILLRTEAGQVDLLDTNGLFIGAIEEARDSYEEKSVKLAYGDRIILYTDGIPEAINADRKEYSNRRLEKTVFQHRNLPLEEFCDAIIDDLENHIGSASVEDDITILVIELSRDEAVSIIKDSKRLVNSHKYYEAIEALEKGLMKFRDNQKILYNLAKNYFRVNNYSRAVAVVEKYVEKDKRNKYAFYIGGASYYQMMDYDNAVEFFDRALAIDSNFSNALFAQGMAYKKKGDMENAVRTFERVVNIDPDNKMALFELKEVRDGKK